MIDEFRKLAPVLQKQILIRLAGSGVGIIMVTLLLICHADWSLVVPGLALAILSLFSATLLFAKCANGDYIKLSVVCRNIERSGLRKRVKAIYVQSEDRMLKIASSGLRIPNLSVGDSLTVYLKTTEPVYDHEGCLVVFHIIAIGKEW